MNDFTLTPLLILSAVAVLIGLIVIIIAWRHTQRTTKAVICWIDASGSTDENLAISAALEGLTDLLKQAKAEKITYLVTLRTFSHQLGEHELHVTIGPRSVIDPFRLVPKLREMIRSNYGGTDMALIYDNTPENTSGIVVSDMVFMFKPETAEVAAARDDIRYIQFGGDDPSRWGHDDLIVEASRELFLDELKHGGKLS